ncbi:MAG TPA: cell division topological specificity factor MinE [Anaerolineae bacterium]|nr:cell division topological specificity factor MinE [Anaerolineae bacterium]MCB9107174.1 cell division topological specificity factor MinE [Anaerolineales bacterium]HRV96679.1 cell division topological specificity factor MinE [Anaerolineae bacterium]
MSFFDRLLGRKESNSSNVAKNRLQLVLVHDRVDLSPGKMDQLKDDLIEVISKYVEIDQHGIDIALTNSNRQSRLTAQIPVVNVRK